jgi:hypothetical protein
VGPEGVATNHHFLLPEDGTAFDFLPGEYDVLVYAGLTRSRRPKLLSEFRLVVTEASSAELQSGDQGLYFDWGPDSMRYHQHLRPVPRDIIAELLRKGTG